MKNKAVRPLLVALSLVTALSVTACGKNGGAGDDTQDTSEWYDVSRENMDEAESSESVANTTTTAADSSEAPEDSSETNKPDSSKPDDSSSSGESSGGNSSPSSGNDNPKNYEEKQLPKEIFSPDVEIFGERNLDDKIALYNIKVNGKVMDIRNETVDTFITTAGIKRNADRAFENPYEMDENKYDGVFWFGGGYGVYANTQDTSKRFSGTQVFIEGAENGFVAAEVDSGIKGKYKIRSVYSCTATTQKDFEVIYAGGIKCGMTRAEIERILGSKGNESKGFTYYANKANLLLISYGKNDIAEEIYLYNDFEDMPIQYLKTEDNGTDDSSSDDSSRPDGEDNSSSEDSGVEDGNNSGVPRDSDSPEPHEVKT